jgi:diguanylate cyclase (GGDEF)-like protein/PAS domain S-box-containing protein
MAHAAGLRTFLSLPLILSGEVYGSFTLSADQTQTFDQATVVQHMSDIASRICIALEKATDHQQLRLLRTALASAANGVFITDRNGHIEWVNAAFLRMSGFTEEEALGATPNLLRSPHNRQAYFEEMWDALARGEVWNGETIERRKDGSEFTAYQIITPIIGPEGETSHYISILEDITEKKAAEERIRRLAHYDQLTDLPNRTLFHDRLHTAISRARREDEHFALMFLDLDRFKQVNDTFGHDTGDLLLREVANRLRTCVRDSDSVARLAGDEFTLLLPGAHTREDAAVVAQKIIEAMTPPVDIDGHALLTSPSIGIAFYPQDGNDEPSLLRAADQAMYTAKAAGRNTFAFYQPLF